MIEFKMKDGQRPGTDKTLPDSFCLIRSWQFANFRVYYHSNCRIDIYLAVTISFYYQCEAYRLRGCRMVTPKDFNDNFSFKLLATELRIIIWWYFWLTTHKLLLEDLAIKNLNDMVVLEIWNEAAANLTLLWWFYIKNWACALSVL